MNYNKLFTILKIVLIIVLVILMVFIQHYKSSDCAYCKFELEDEEVGIKKFMNAYSEQCFPKYGGEFTLLENNSKS